MGADYIWTDAHGFVACEDFLHTQTGDDLYQAMADVGYRQGNTYGDGDEDISFEIWVTLVDPLARYPLPRQYPYCVWFTMPSNNVLSFWIPTDLDMLAFLRAYVPVVSAAMASRDRP